MLFGKVGGRAAAQNIITHIQSPFFFLVFRAGPDRHFQFIPPTGLIQAIKAFFYVYNIKESQ